jgi:hypothetical protein
MDGVSSFALTIVSFSNVNSNINATRRLSFLRKVVPGLQTQSSPSSIAIEFTTTASLESFGDQYSSIDAMVNDLNSQVFFAV